MLICLCVQRIKDGICEQLQYLDGTPPNINHMPKYGVAQDARIVRGLPALLTFLGFLAVLLTLCARPRWSANSSKSSCKKLSTHAATVASGLSEACCLDERVNCALYEIAS